MAILPGRRLGPYEILSAIGAGGMGEVYKARDTRLDRIVAIKVLPAHFADRPELRERFEREAKTIASLNHPHICMLFDTCHQDGIDFLVLEYLEGETLAQRLVKGPLPLEQVLQYAIEIADALDKAHRKGVTHRDLKPGNIMLTKTGTKLLDFGLAKLKQEVAPANVPLSDLPTAKDPLTAQGSIVGTLQYMAPEQLEGKEVDARADIFAFGAVVYEMATHKRAFDGKSQASVISAIMSSDPPPMSSLQPMTPPALDRVVKKCFAKEPDKRWQAASDVCDELKWIAEGGSQTSQPVATLAGRRKVRERLGWIVAAMAIAALLAVLTSAILNQHRPASDAQPIRFTIDPPEKGFFALGLASPWPAVSPDGRQIVYEATSADGQSSLWVRSLSSLSAQVLLGTSGSYVVSLPFWSPDSRYVGFFSSDGKLKKVAVSGGPSETLCDAASAGGGTWNHDGTIVFSQTTGLFRVSAAGGEAQALTTVESRGEEYAYISPRFLPDGKHFLYVVLASKPADAGIYVGSLDSAERVRLLNVISQVEYSVGHLLFVRGDTLLAQPFDVDRLQVTGDVFPLAEGVGNNPANGRSAFGASPNGVLVYRGNNAGAGQLAWLDRTGKQLVMVAEQKITHFSLSADEKHAAVAVNGDLWVADLGRGTTSRLTFGSLAGDGSVWSPNGSRVYFAGHQGGVAGLYQKASDGSRNEELVLKKAGVLPVDVSRDGKLLLYQQTEAQTGVDLWILPLSGDRQSRPFLQGRFDEAEGQFSPDGRWVAYVSNETGRIEVYVQPSVGPSGKWQVSTGGGEQPRWRGDGKEIFYVSGGRLMAVDIKTEPQFQAGQPRILFDGAVAPHDWRTGGNHYAVSADGKRFLILRAITGGRAIPLTVVVNWAAGLKK